MRIHSNLVNQSLMLFHFPIWKLYVSSLATNRELEAEFRVKRYPKTSHNLSHPPHYAAVRARAFGRWVCLIDYLVWFVA